MSIWKDEWEDYEKDKYDFEQWLDSIEGEEGETDEEKYNREMEIQHAHEKEKGKYTDAEYEKWLEDNVDDMAEQQSNPNYPEWVISTPNFTMTVSNN
tara:strand:+ start:1397 stop:1687 length:291 start_codon:yes stop_codon:yes gene_type:complete